MKSKKERKRKREKTMVKGFSSLPVSCVGLNTDR